MIILILAILGLMIAVYGITVERALKQDMQYKAVCDISDKISCTRPMLSQYNSMLGISNSLAAALYYALIIALVVLQQPQLLMFVIVGGLVATAIFAYILYFKIRSLCLICTSLYLINIALAVAYFMASSH